jgi:hypothetical protein
MNDEPGEDELEALHVAALQEALQLVDAQLYQQLRCRLIDLGIDDPLLINLTIIELETTRVMEGQATLVVDQSGDERVEVRVEPESLL